MPLPRHTTTNWQKGSFYHLYNRAARQKTIFHHHDNYIYTIRKLKQNCQKYHLTLIAYCLMPNHYHLLVRQNSTHKAGLLPQHTFLSYTKAYNKRYTASGTLFQGRFGSKEVSIDDYILYLCKYIHFNPVKDGMVERPQDWDYSNYQEWIGLREGTLVDHAFIKTHFGSHQKYRQEMEQFLIDKNYQIEE